MKKKASPLNLSTILSILSVEKETLEKDYGVTKIGLFGSFVSGNATSKSDIDVVIEMVSAHRFRDYFSVKRLLERKLSRKVDLGFEHTLKHAVKDHINILYV